MFQARELLIAEQLADASVLVNELVNFRMTLREAGRDTYGNGGDAEHDDYITAAALKPANMCSCGLKWASATGSPRCTILAGLATYVQPFWSSTRVMHAST